MKIKEAQGAAADLAALLALLDLPALPARTKGLIEQEIRTVRAGEKGEREAAYEIDFHHGASRNWAVLHDLRIEHEGMTAQIDHLLINRFLDCWVCETKHFRHGVSINEHGEFTRFDSGRPVAIPSPLEQNRRHLHLLSRILQSDKVRLPSRLGLKLQPRLHSVILISKDARITRPRTQVAGIDRIVKSDQLRTFIERAVDDESTLTSLMTMGKLLSSEALEDFARQVARLHRPSRRDWRARFGIDRAIAEATTRATRELHRATRSDATECAEAASACAVAERVPAPVSTSKLGAAMGLPNAAATLERLRAAGYLRWVDGADHLTDAGRRAGGRYVEKSRFGPYFTWPSSLRC